MPVTVVVGAQWGDEGKGRIVDYLAQNMDVVIRFNGGPNAGHTVINEFGEFKLHLVPSGIFNPKVISIIGNGVVVDPEILREEINDLEAKGISVKNLKISSHAHLILPWHIMLDKAEEEFRGEGEIGTTKRGVGPAFADKAARKGIRVEDLWNEKQLRARLCLIFKEKQEILEKVYGKWGLGNFDDIYHWLLYERTLLEPFVRNTESLIWEALEKNKNILLEGAQGVLLDLDFGTYPNVTSSSCGAASASQGSGIPIQRIDEIIGVVKAYTTRVGSKAQLFPTEMPKDIANALRKRAGEYGATTGRPRRIGWLDALLVKYSAMTNGFTGLAITRLDNLTGISPLKICSGYRTRKGKILPPDDLSTKGLPLDELDEVEPLYPDELSGWKKFPKGCRKYEDLPKEAKIYLERVENLVGVPIKYISVGAERDQIIVK